MHVIVHIPHASRAIPDEFREQFLLSDEALAAELLAMTDLYTGRLFEEAVADAATIVYPVSRLVVDPERFADDALEPMSQRGMGMVYTRTSGGAPLRRSLADTERAALVRRFYEPHHAALTAAVERGLEERGGCLIIDAHSFPSTPLPCDLDQAPGRPDICLGTDALHTPKALIACLENSFRAMGLTVAINRPYAGTLVPARFFGRDARVKSIMIEINRRLYMDEGSGEATAGLSMMRRRLRTVLNSPAFRQAVEAGHQG